MCGWGLGLRLTLRRLRRGCRLLPRGLMLRLRVRLWLLWGRSSAIGPFISCGPLISLWLASSDCATAPTFPANPSKGSCDGGWADPCTAIGAAGPAATVAAAAAGMNPLAATCCLAWGSPLNMRWSDTTPALACTSLIGMWGLTGTPFNASPAGPSTHFVAKMGMPAVSARADAPLTEPLRERE